MFKKPCFDTITMLQTFETNYVCQFWEHFEILKKKLHFNIVINITYNMYYKEENDDFSQVWVIYKIYYKQENDGFSQVWVIYKICSKEKKWWLFSSLSHDMFCVYVNCLGFMCALFSFQFALTICASFWFQFVLTIFFLSLCILTWLWTQHIEILSWSSRTLLFITCVQLKNTSKTF